MKWKISAVLAAFLVLASAFICIKYFPFVFSRTVVGEVSGVERVLEASPILTAGSAPPPSQVFSFAVAIREEKSNEIVTASSEDRQWAVVNPGQCAEAKFFPYPPWHLEKSGTYHSARLIRLFDCPKKP